MGVGGEGVEGERRAHAALLPFIRKLNSRAGRGATVVRVRGSQGALIPTQRGHGPASTLTPARPPSLGLQFFYLLNGTSSFFEDGDLWEDSRVDLPNPAHTCSCLCEHLEHLLSQAPGPMPMESTVNPEWI